MKKTALFSLFFCLTALAFAQRPGTASLKLKRASGLSSAFRTVAAPVMSARDGSDDCKPPPCSGIIDPWTCECYPDIKDPWEDDKIAARMRGVQSMEQAMSRGQGQKILPASLVTAAKRKYPGSSPRALYQRAGLYADALRKN